MIDNAGALVECCMGDCEDDAVTFIRDDNRYNYFPVCVDHVPVGVIPTAPEWEVADGEY